MGSENGLTDERNRNTDSTKEQRLLTSDAIEEEDDEEKVANGTDEVIEGRYKKIFIAGDT